MSVVRERPLLVWLSRHKPTKINTPELAGYDVVQVAFRYTSWQQAYQDIIFASKGRWPTIVAYVINDNLEGGFVRFLKQHIPDVILLRMWTEEGKDPSIDTDAKIWFINTTLNDQNVVIRKREMFDLKLFLAEWMEPKPWVKQEK